MLDTLEDNLARHPREDHRTTIVHFGFSTPEQVDRIARLGAIVSANPYYLTALADRYGEQGVGPERSDAIVRLGEVARAGVSFSLHSDMPMAPGQPLFLMWCAVTRTTVSGRTARPDLRISAEQALRAVTLDAAYSIRLEHEIGSIEVGKKANLTVLADNPLTVDPAAIKDCRPLRRSARGLPPPGADSGAGDLVPAGAHQVADRLLGQGCVDGEAHRALGQARARDLVTHRVHRCWAERVHGQVARRSLEPEQRLASVAQRGQAVAGALLGLGNLGPGEPEHSCQRPVLGPAEAGEVVVHAAHAGSVGAAETAPPRPVSVRRRSARVRRRRSGPG